MPYGRWRLVVEDGVRGEINGSLVSSRRKYSWSKTQAQRNIDAFRVGTAATVSTYLSWTPSSQTGRPIRTTKGGIARAFALIPGGSPHHADLCAWCSLDLRAAARMVRACSPAASRETRRRRAKLRRLCPCAGRGTCSMCGSALRIDPYRHPSATRCSSPPLLRYAPQLRP